MLARMSILCLALVSLSAPPLAAQQATLPIPGDSARLALAKTLVGLLYPASDSVMAGTMISRIRELSPGIPPAFFDSVVVRTRREMVGIQDSLVPLYAARFSEDDMRVLIAFFGNPLWTRFKLVNNELAAAQVALIQRLVATATDDMMKYMRMRPVPRP
ncbi:MAG: DUF2059 domain-containing protein [Gemmatimonadales bacterium]|nr:DUF2059 domain-containing protein [Gemmatimonadales bacterium]